MSEPLSLMYGIDQQTRCIVGVHAEQERTLFLAGTLSIKQDNQLCVLEVDDDWLQISKRSFAHPFEFHPDGQKAAVVFDKTLNFMDINDSLETVHSMQIACKGSINAISWNPHSNGSLISVAYDDFIKGIDYRSLDSAFIIESVNTPNVRNLDYNPNVQYILATCGDDCKVSIWDTRKVMEPLKSLHDHSHWVWSVRFNPIHDQLLLSVGSDARIFLNNLESLSSESMHALDFVNDDAENTRVPKLEDGRLEKLEEHEESVYSCAWATNDPWVFATLSLDGRVVISRVKRHHKYAILQL
ncbi:unnamed protein product [Dracunculus medinensis]|uniref:WD_REPEATS_REGION domain-containing protein n=1 Tax=Dracunculus medinensis TaxID=318479 RepID=A0A0N4UAM2_DRAME|nr:unnamed protein product [Dracunculus medinensis]